MSVQSASEELVESHTAIVTEEDIEEFAELSGDKNPLHLNESEAQSSIFSGRIAHGMLVASYVSAALEKLPGTVILLSTDFTFDNPVRPGRKVTAEVSPNSYTDEGMHVLKAEVVKENGDIALHGTATVKLND